MKKTDMLVESTSVPMAWRQEEVRDILAAPQSKKQVLLGRYRPFNDAFLEAANLELPETRYSLKRIEIDSPPCGQNHDPMILTLVHSHKRRGFRIFLGIPFFAFVQDAIEIPSHHLLHALEEMNHVSYLVFKIMHRATGKSVFYREIMVSWHL